MTSSPGSISAAIALKMACLPPLVTRTWSAETSRPESRRVLAAMASRSAGKDRRRGCSGASGSWTAGGRLHDVGRGREVRLAGPEADHRATRRLEGLGLGVDGQGGRLGDSGDAGGGSGEGGREEGAVMRTSSHRVAASRRVFHGPRCGGTRGSTAPASPRTLTPGGVRPWSRHARTRGLGPGRAGRGRHLEGSSSIGRVPVSKTGGWGFESLLPCVPTTRPTGRRNDRASRPTTVIG